MFPEVPARCEILHHPNGNEETGDIRQRIPTQCEFYAKEVYRENIGRYIWKSNHEANRFSAFLNVTCADLQVGNGKAVAVSRLMT